MQSLLDAEGSSPWRDERIGRVAQLLAETAEKFFVHGDHLARETAERMGVTPGEVWLETIFPSVWGLLSTRRGLLSNAKPYEPLGRLKHFSARVSHTEFAGRKAIKVLPANVLERLLLPGFSGHALIKESRSDVAAPPASSTPDSAETGLALCLLPFNLASIGVLDIVHLLCKRQNRVIAKVSEKVEFAGPILEKILAPLVSANALRLVYGGPNVGAWLAARPEFSHIHLTGSARTAAAVAQVTGQQKLTAELGGVTLAIVFPDALLTEADRRQVARQVAFGALANNGQHCVSFQMAVVPAPELAGFRKAALARVQARYLAQRRQRVTPVNSWIQVRHAGLRRGRTSWPPRALGSLQRGLGPTQNIFRLASFTDLMKRCASSMTKHLDLLSGCCLFQWKASKPGHWPLPTPLV